MSERRSGGKEKEHILETPPENWLNKTDFINILQIAAKNIEKDEREALDFPIPVSSIIAKLIVSEARLKRFVEEYGRGLVEYKTALAKDPAAYGRARRFYDVKTASCIAQAVINRLVVSKGTISGFAFKKGNFEAVMQEMPAGPEKEKIRRQQIAWLSEAIIMIENLKIKINPNN